MAALQQFRIRVDEVLQYVWDPIGISGAPEARDEYHNYVQQVLNLALADDEDRLAEHLHSLETKHMGLTGDKAHCCEVAELLMRWKLNLVEPGEAAT